MNWSRQDIYNRRVLRRATEVRKRIPWSNAILRRIKILVQLRREERRCKRQIQRQNRDQAARPVKSNDNEAPSGHNNTKNR